MKQEQLSFPGLDPVKPYKISFTVGLTKEGILQFRIDGQEANSPVELAGLLHYAEIQVDKYLSAQFKTTDIISLSRLDEIVRRLESIEKRLNKNE